MNEAAFVSLTAPHRRALHVHCYRILGSLFDADDALQETLLRAWQGIDGYEPRAPLRAWLYRIATNVCLRMLEQRSRRHYEPYPDRLLDPAPDPQSIAEEREQIGLAFIAATQLLGPRARVTLILRDVLGWSAKDVAELLETSVPAVNSSLQRARATLATADVRAHAPAGERTERELMQRFATAFAAVDIDGIVALLSEDALLTMPPEPMRFEGRAAVGEFFATQPLQGRLDQIPLVPTRANRQPALAAYVDGKPYGVMVFAIRDDLIAGVTGFADQPALFGPLGVPLGLAP